MRQIPDASADSLQGFVGEAITPGSLIHTDGWVGYDRLEQSGYGHRITFVKGQRVLRDWMTPGRTLARSPPLFYRLVERGRFARPHWYVSPSG